MVNIHQLDRLIKYDLSCPETLYGDYQNHISDDMKIQKLKIVQAFVNRFEKTKKVNPNLSSAQIKSIIERAVKKQTFNVFGWVDRDQVTTAMLQAGFDFQIYRIGDSYSLAWNVSQKSLNEIDTSYRRSSRRRSGPKWLSSEFRGLTNEEIDNTKIECWI